MSLTLDYNKFAAMLDSVSGVNVHSAKTNYGWFSWDGDKNAFCQVIEYEFEDSDGDQAQYRSWHMETSLMKQDQGLVVSTKIDHIRGGVEKDDHIILICGFNGAGALVVAQASVQITSDSDQNLTVPPVTLAMAGSSDQIDNLVYDQIAKHDFKNAGRNTIANLTKANIIALRESVKKS